jgi:hypothetical protein
MMRIAEKIQHLKELLSITPPRTDRHKGCLRRLSEWYASKVYRTNDLSDIEESIKYRRLELDATHSSTKLIIPLGNLSHLLRLAFAKTSKPIYLDESITLDYDILELKSARNIHGCLYHLCSPGPARTCLGEERTAWKPYD